MSYRYKRLRPFLHLINYSLVLLRLKSSIHPKKYFVSDKLKIVYIPISKSANSTIKSIILEAEGVAKSELESDDPYFIHRNLNLKKYTRRKWNSRWNDYYTFTVVRHPLKRFTSAYSNKFKDKNKVEKRGFEFDDYLFGYFKVTDSLSDLINKIKKIPMRAFEEHFISQAYWLYNHHKVNPRIYKLEKLDEFYSDFTSWTGYEVFYENKKNQSNTEVMLSEEQKLLLSEIYRKDMECFNYEKL